MDARLNIEELDSLFQTILQLCQQTCLRDEFFYYVQSIWEQQQKSPLDSLFLEKIFELLRLTGLLKRKYYQTSVLGSFFLAKNISCSSFVLFFQEKLDFLLNRYPSKILFYTNFQILYFTCCIWFTQVLKEKFSGWKLQIFQEILCLTFEWYDKKDSLHKEIRPVLNEYLGEQYKRIHARRTLKSRPRTIPIGKRPQEFFTIPQPKKGRRGEVLAKVLIDIYDWIETCSFNGATDTSINYDLPFFDILSHAKEAKIISEDETSRSVTVSHYTRIVTWIMKKKITNRWKKFLTNTPHLAYIEDLGMSALELIKDIRKNISINFVKLKPNKKRRVLVFKPTSRPDYAQLAHQAKVMDFTCSCCDYLAEYTKIDCLFFKKLEFLTKKGYLHISDEMRPLYTDRIAPVFSTKVACPFLSLKKAFRIQLKSPNLRKATCIGCQSPLEVLPSPEIEVICQCKAQYSFISERMAENGVYECQLPDKHSIRQDLTQGDSYLFTLVKKDFSHKEQPDLSQTQVFNPQVDKLTTLFKRGPDYVQIKEEDSILYEKTKKELMVNRRSYSLDSLTLIDTEKWNPILQALADDKPPSKFIHRPYNITLSNEDKATLSKDIHGLLQVKRKRNKEVETYQLQHLQTIYNVGKPRLNKIFGKWGVNVLYSSTKGVLPTPTEEIKDAMELPGVQRTLQQLHLQGLMMSLMNATYYLAELAQSCGKAWLGNQYLTWMNRLLRTSPTRLTNLYQNSRTRSFRQVSLLEAWFSRPFAEGVRKFVIAIQDTKHPLIQRPYGRAVARRVNKQEKHGVDYMGGYTSFDAALNCINRRLRHQLRIWNAKAGLGFNTIPLFVHTSSDKSGRAGHLDLEEVGRILSRITLCEAIIKGKIRHYHFKKRYDDDYVPYYVPKDHLVRWLRGTIVKKEIFTRELFYYNQWMSFRAAHKQHVHHLCSCLERSLEFSNHDDRIDFLQQSYQPLIFQPELKM